MTVRQKVRALNALKVCKGCGVNFNFKDIIYVEDIDLFAVHGSCMTKVPPPDNRAFSFVPLDMALEIPGNLEAMEAKARA